MSFGNSCDQTRVGWHAKTCQQQCMVAPFYMRPGRWKGCLGPCKDKIFHIFEDTFSVWVFWWEIYKTFPGIHFARFPGIVCPLNRSGKDTLLWYMEKCELKKTLPKTIWKCKLAKFLHVYLPIVKQAREEARGKVEQREEKQKIHARRCCTILKWNEVIYNPFSRCKKNTIIP